MLVKGMNYLLDIKKYVLVTPNHWIIASHQPSSNATRFSLSVLLLHSILVCFFSLFRIVLYLFARLKSYEARLCIHFLVIPIDCR